MKNEGFFMKNLNFPWKIVTPFALHFDPFEEKRKLYFRTSCNNSLSNSILCFTLKYRWSIWCWFTLYELYLHLEIGPVLNSRASRSRCNSMSLSNSSSSFSSSSYTYNDCCYSSRSCTYNVSCVTYIVE